MHASSARRHDCREANRQSREFRRTCYPHHSRHPSTRSRWLRRRRRERRRRLSPGWAESQTASPVRRRSTTSTPPRMTSIEPAIVAAPMPASAQLETGVAEDRYRLGRAVPAERVGGEPVPLNVRADGVAVPAERVGDEGLPLRRTRCERHGCRDRECCKDCGESEQSLHRRASDLEAASRGRVRERSRTSVNCRSAAVNPR